MVHFNEKNFIVTLQGDKEDYISTIRSLLSLLDISSRNIDNNTAKDYYYLYTLIDGLLPDSRQIVSAEDAEFLENTKKQNKNIVSAILQQ